MSAWRDSTVQRSTATIATFAPAPAQDERGCREVALDPLDRVAEEAAADLPDPERRVDRAPCGACVEGSVHRWKTGGAPRLRRPSRVQSRLPGRYERQPRRPEAGVEVAEGDVHVPHAPVVHLVLPDRHERHLDRVRPRGPACGVLVHRPSLRIVELDAAVADRLPRLEVPVGRRLGLERRRGRMELLHVAVDVAAHAAAVQEPVVGAGVVDRRRRCRSRCP